MPPDSTPSVAATPGPRRPLSATLLVSAGIFLSRIAGLVRQRVFAHYFGNSDAADVFTNAFKIPNFLQNLFGEGALSASFIPVYARLVAQGEEKEAGRVAGAVFAGLALIVSALVLLGTLAAPWMVWAIAPGFTGEKRELTIQLTRIFFPGAGLLVLSAWCLGILNSHRKFFLSYVSPVIWNAVMIGTLIALGARLAQVPLAVALAWGSVAGSAAQFLIQLPQVLHLLGKWRPNLAFANPHFRTVARNFLPAFVSRGIVQISAFIDTSIASLLPSGAPAALGYAQTLYTLPISLFGMAVSAAELPAMSAALGTEEEIAAILRQRLDAGLRRIAFFIIASAAAFLALGDVIAAAIFKTGVFNAGDVRTVWAILAGSTIGLLAATMGRLYSSAFYALRDTRTPLKFALIRVLLVAGLDYVGAIWMPRWLGIDRHWGVVGLTAASGLAAWVEFTLLRRALNRRIGPTGIDAPRLARLWLAAALAAGAAYALKHLLPPNLPPALAAAPIFAAFGVLYLGLTSAFRIPEALVFTRRLSRPRR